MLKEVDIAGIYVAPFAVALLIAALLFLVLEWALNRVGIERWVWHRPLFDLAVFVCLLSAVVLALGRAQGMG